MRQELALTLAGKDMQLLDIPEQLGASLDYYKPWLEQWRRNPPRAVITPSSMPNGFWKATEQATQGHSHLVRVLGTDEEQRRLRHWHHVGIDHAALGELVAQQVDALGARRLGLLIHRRYIDPFLPREYSAKRHTGHTPMILNIGHALRRRGRSADFTVHYSSVPDCPGHPLAPKNVASICRWLESEVRPDLIVGQDFRLTVVATVAATLGLQLGRDLRLIGLENTPWSVHFGFRSIGFNEQVIAEHVADLVYRDIENTQAVMSINVTPVFEQGPYDLSHAVQNLRV